MKRILSGLNLHGRFVGTTVAALVTLAGPARGAGSPPEATLDCVLEPYEVVEVSSTVRGVIKEIHVDRNDMVGEGQLLVELDSDVERAQVERARTRANLQTHIELREAELEFNLRNQQRLAKLYKTETVSLHLKDEADTDTRKSRLQLRNAREEKRLAEQELAEAEAILALRSMHSPIDGVVVERNTVVGEYVEAQSILRLARLDPLRVEAIAPVDLFGSVAVGMRVEVLTEHAGTGAHFATVTMVDRIIDPASGTFGIRAELPNPDLAIPSGLRCTVQFLDEPDPDAVIATVPVAAPAGLCEASVRTVITGYDVLVDPADNDATTRELVQGLRAKGITDVYVVAKGTHRGQVSLGAYSKAGNAEKRQEAVANRGFAVSLVTRTQEQAGTGCQHDGHLAGVAH